MKTTSKYKSFTIRDFLNDDYFIQSMTKPSQESDEYWLLLNEMELINSEVFNEAKQILINFAQAQKKSINLNDINNLWLRIEKTNRQRALKATIKKGFYWSAAALLCLGISIYVFKNNKASNIDEMVKSINYATISSYKDQDGILLIPSNLEIINLSHSKKLDYSTNSSNKTNTYNHLIVPYGQKTTLILSDQTKLHINAGTHVIFPSAFNKDKREIYVEGEVYAEVSKDTAHPFIIRNERMDIEVLGTQVNFKAYKETSNSAVVLVSGKVAVQIPNLKPHILTPNQGLFITDGIAKIRNIPATNYVSWIDGELSYSNETLAQILQDLSNYYGYDITYNASDIKDITCSGNLKIKPSLSEMLKGLSLTIPIEYTYDEKTQRYNISITN